MRKYKKRIKSTSRKTYQDYLNFRKEQLSKGYVLQDEMSESSFNAFYDRLTKAKKVGEIKSGPWQELKRRERYLSRKQATFLAKAKERYYENNPEEFKERFGKELKFSIKSILQSDKDDIRFLGLYINETKESGVYGGKYE